MVYVFVFSLFTELQEHVFSDKVEAVLGIPSRKTQSKRAGVPGAKVSGLVKAESSKPLTLSTQTDAAAQPKPPPPSAQAGRAAPTVSSALSAS